jgi:hypothetical protein
MFSSDALSHFSLRCLFNETTRRFGRGKYTLPTHAELENLRRLLFVRKKRSLNRLTPWHPPAQISRVIIIQDYDDKKKHYHNLEKGYLVHGEHARFLISRPQSSVTIRFEFPW